MVGIFSRFPGSRTGHQRAQSGLDGREAVPPDTENAGADTAPEAASHGVEAAVEFKPVERPIEPVDNVKPLQCPLPEPSILNDGRIWKERLSVNVQRSDLSVIKEGADLESEVAGTAPRRKQFSRSILPSVSAPEHNILKLLEECDASEI